MLLKRSKHVLQRKPVPNTNLYVIEIKIFHWLDLLKTGYAQKEEHKYGEEKEKVIILQSILLYLGGKYVKNQNKRNNCKKKWGQWNETL